ncbi:hypothetical protein [Microbacterium enclense]|uniref:hypothetical protein n=1 Tax=Microbacterium enclense TaxID=993073 RepID=UPI003F809CE3
MALDTQAQQSIVIAAAILAGPTGTEQDVASHVGRIAGYLSEGSLAMNAFAAIEKRDENVIKTKGGFPATIIGIDKETTSTRAVVLLKTKPSKWHPNSQEFIRTQRTDNAEGLAQARALQGLIGHRVFITAVLEGTGDVNVRIIRSCEDKGVDPDYMATVTQLDGRNVQTNPEFIYDYNFPAGTNSGGMGPDMLAKLASRQQVPQPA